MRKFFFILMGILILTSLSGCGSAENSSRKTVGIVMPTKATERWNRDGKYLKEIIAGDPADNNAYYFYGGAMDVLKPYIDSGRFVVPSGKMSFEQTSTPFWSTDTAFKNMQNTLASYYSSGKRLDAVLCSNDHLALGAMQAIQSLKKRRNYSYDRK